MTITINLNRKTFVILLLIGLLCMSVTLAYAAHDDPNIIHACVNNSSGTIKVVQDASECAANEAALALASESATDGLQAALDTETTARQTADNNLQSQVTTALNAANSALAKANSAQAAVQAETTARQTADNNLHSQVIAAKSTADSAQATANALDNLLVHFSRFGNEVYITGANLHVVNGSGGTANVNSLGNLIIGYNEPRIDQNNRSGSHMLVMGSQNNYRSYGGIVTGRYNEASGEYASVSGEFGNVANGPNASISGGYGNQASGGFASVSGGVNNVASHTYASVSGGAYNEASGPEASVSGGYQRQAIGQYDWVAGGLLEDH